MRIRVGWTWKAWLAGGLLGAAAGAWPQPTNPNANANGQWEGHYTCFTQPGVFSRATEAINTPVRLRIAGGTVSGTREQADYLEKFAGAVNAAGEVSLAGDGFWAGAVQRSTTLETAGTVSNAGNWLMVTGQRVEREGARTVRVLDCTLALERTADPMQAVREIESLVRQGAAVEAPAAAATAAAPATPAGQATSEPAPRQDASVAMARRHALVIGNNAYLHVQRLANAVSDAHAMADALAAAGYTVTSRMDLDERGFKRVLRDFRAQVQAGDEVVLFFAGHGVQLGGANFLLPVDIRGDNEEQVRDESLPLQRLLDDLSDRRAGFTLAIIDACRDNPFRSATRALTGRGLAPTTAATGQMVIYSAGSGQQALDRLGPDDPNPNGLFTRVFLREMEKPDLTVDRVLRNVRTEVVRLARSVGHQQTPALYDQAVGDFYLRRPR